MSRRQRYRRCGWLVLTLAVGTCSGCINSEKFTSGRLPYGGGSDRLAATKPRDPFLNGQTASGSMTQTASAGPQTPTAYAATQPAPSTMPPGYASSPTGAPQAHGGLPAMQAGPQTVDTRQAAYVPTTSENPFNTASTAPVAPSMPSSMQAPAYTQAPHSSPAIEQISYQMPAGMPTASTQEPNPFAEVQGAASGVIYQTASPQMMPSGAASDAWQPSQPTSSSFAATEFLPPR